MTLNRSTQDEQYPSAAPDGLAAKNDFTSTDAMWASLILANNSVSVRPKNALMPGHGLTWPSTYSQAIPNSSEAHIPETQYGLARSYVNESPDPLDDFFAFNLSLTGLEHADLMLGETFMEDVDMEITEPHSWQSTSMNRMDTRMSVHDAGLGFSSMITSESQHPYTRYSENFSQTSQQRTSIASSSNSFTFSDERLFYLPMVDNHHDLAPKLDLSISAPSGNVQYNEAILPAQPVAIPPRRKGRKGHIYEPEKRAKVAQVRQMGACSECSRRKVECSGETPCNKCVARFNSLARLLCRNDQPKDWANLILILLPVDAPWHPRMRLPTSYMKAPRKSYDTITRLPFRLGVGPDIWLKVHPVLTSESKACSHTHIEYEWPSKDPINGSKCHTTHFVLPAALADKSRARYKILKHLEKVLDDHFDKYPHYDSPLKVLHLCHTLYLNLDKDRFLGKALKLLTLVHLAGDIFINQNVPVVQEFISNTLGSWTDEHPFSPCLIRGEIGHVIADIAKELLEELLEELQQRTMSRDCKGFAIVISVYLVLAMFVETVQYHICKASQHETQLSNFDYNLPGLIQTCQDIEDRGFAALLRLYRTCYSVCHTKLHLPFPARPQAQGHPSAADMFTLHIRTLLQEPGVISYIKYRTAIEINPEMPLEYFFDRLLSRLFLSFHKDVVASDSEATAKHRNRANTR